MSPLALVALMGVQRPNGLSTAAVKNLLTVMALLQQKP